MKRFVLYECPNDFIEFIFIYCSINYKYFELKSFDMGSLDVSNKLFLVIGIIFEVWFILMYALEYRYVFYPVGTPIQQVLYGFLSIQGFLLILFLFLLFFLGFTIVNTYVSGSAYSSALFSFMILVFTIQYYFIIRSFWIGIGLGNDGYDRSLGNGEFQMLRILSGDSRLNSSYNTNVGMTEAIVCALSMLVAYMALAGRVGAFQVFILCFFGVFFYGFNETVIWRHAISDTGYTLRLFLFGSSFGIVTAFILSLKDKIATTSTVGYFASRHTRAYALLGACFVWLFLPILSCVSTIYGTSTNAATVTYLYPSILNVWFALSGSCCASFCVSILLGRKIHPHDIVFSSFTGGIAYSATATLNPDPFPALLCGLLIGIITTIMNHKLKKPLNNPEVMDTQGTLYTFFTSGLFGGIYSACLAAVNPYGPDAPLSSSTWAQSTGLRWAPYDRNNFHQGGMQLAATFISIAIGILSSLAVALILYLSTNLQVEQVFNDQTFAEISDEHETKQAPAN